MQTFTNLQGKNLRQVGLLALSVLLLATLLVACGDPSPTATPVPATPTTAPLDAAGVAKGAAEKLKVINSLHFDVTIRAGEVKITDGINFQEARGDFSKPNKFRAKLRVVLPIGKVDAETVGIEKEQWLNLANLGSWNKLPDNIGFRADVLFDPDKGLSAVVGKLKDNKFVGTGTEKLGDLEVYHIKGVVAGADIGPITSNTLGKNDVDFEAWVTKNDFLTRQVTFKEISTQPNASDWLLQFSKFDEKVEIKRPAGV